MPKFFPTFICVFLFITNATFGQKKLDKSKSELNANSGAKSQSSSSSSNSGSSGDSCDNEVVGTILDVFFKVSLAAFKYGAIGDYTNEDHLHNVLSPYPYYDGKAGNFDADDTVSKNRGRIDLENSFVYSSSNLYGNHMKAKLRPFQYFYLQTDFHQLFEFNKVNKTTDQLSLFQFNLCYDRIRMERFNFGWNLGATYVGNEVKKAGFAYGLNAEYFMGNRVSFLASGKWSKINGLPVNTFEVQTKLHRKKYFVLMGFEHMKIATPTYNFITLGGGVYF